METRVIHINRAPDGWQDDPSYVYIGRAVPRKGIKASQWANPFTVAKHGREGALTEYERYVTDAIGHCLRSGDQQGIANLKHLHGKTLVCWCAPEGGVTRHDKPWCCHGQVLAQLAAELTEEKI